MLTISLVASPHVVFKPDYRGYWVQWEIRVTGWKPWRAYELSTCNYPPVVLYALTIADAVRGLFGISWKSPFNITMVKLPNIAAHLIGALVLYRAFRPRPRIAAALVTAWLLSMNLFINMALWGQWDIILTVFLLLALLDLRRGSMWMCGAWLGLALATKVQAIFILPVIGIYLLARSDFRSIGKAAVGAAIAMTLAFLPMALAGKLDKSLAVYHSSVDTFPFRTVDAWNIWAICNTVEGQFIGGERHAIMKDNRPLFGITDHFTHRGVGLILFGAYVIALLFTVARRRTIGDVLVAVPLCGVAMFMLATQMHERYLGPPATLMIFWLLMPLRYRIHFAYWTAMAGINQFIVMVRANPFGMDFRPSTDAFAFIGMSAALINMGMFAWVSWLYFSPKFDGTPLTLEPTREPNLEAARPAERTPALAVPS